MAPLNEDQLEQIRNDRKNQIMTAALKVFAENGIKLTKISMIAAEAGISHGLLYHYFKSKEEVLHSSLEWKMAGGTNEILQEIDALELTPLGKIKQFLKIGLSEGNSDIFRIIQHLSRLSNPIPKQTQDLIEYSGELYIKKLLPLFIEGQKMGEIIEGDPEELLELFLTVVSGIMSDDLPWWQENIDRKIALLIRMFTVR
ncbi:TetR/AcrR family transcriptional regulator [Neobacillus sp. K501]